MDQIPSIYHRDGVEVLSLPLRSIVNLSIKLLFFPEECKIDELKPAQGLIIETADLFRFCRQYQKLLKDQFNFKLEATLIRKKLIYMCQSGFRRNQSTGFCLAQLIEFVLTGMDKQMHAGVIRKHLIVETMEVSLKKMKIFWFRGIFNQIAWVLSLKEEMFSLY